MGNCASLAISLAPLLFAAVTAASGTNETSQGGIDFVMQFITNNIFEMPDNTDLPVILGNNPHLFIGQGEALAPFAFDFGLGMLALMEFMKLIFGNQGPLRLRDHSRSKYPLGVGFRSSDYFWHKQEMEELMVVNFSPRRLNTSLPHLPHSGNHTHGEILSGHHHSHSTLQPVADLVLNHTHMLAVGEPQEEVDELYRRIGTHQTHASMAQLRNDRAHVHSLTTSTPTSASTTVPIHAGVQYFADQCINLQAAVAHQPEGLYHQHHLFEYKWTSFY